MTITKSTSYSYDVFLHFTHSWVVLGFFPSELQFVATLSSPAQKIQSLPPQASPPSVCCLCTCCVSATIFLSDSSSSARSMPECCCSHRSTLSFSQCVCWQEEAAIQWPFPCWEERRLRLTLALLGQTRGRRSRGAGCNRTFLTCLYWRSKRQARPILW